MNRPGPAKRSLGQNFLVDENIQRKIVAALEADSDDVVVEIGPGRGALTQHLAGRVRHLVLIEIDDGLARELADTYGGRADVMVVHADVLAADLTSLTAPVARIEDVLVVGNIPYNITSPIIFHLLARPRPREIVLMVQEEVADRIVAPVGTKAYGALSIGVRAIASVDRIFKVGRRAFRPTPTVDSTVIRIRPQVPDTLSEPEEARLRRLVRAAFQWRRKKLRKILRDHHDLGYEAGAVERAAELAGVSLDERPERLSPERFVELSAALPEVRTPPNL